MLRLPMCAVACLLAASSVQATSMRLCLDEKSHLPFVTPTSEGVIDILIRDAAKEAGIVLEPHAAPLTRCREEIRADAADAFPVAPYTASLTGFMVFPMNAGNPDPSRASMFARASVFRRVGSRVNWDGTRFTGLDTPVLIPFGAAMLADRVNGLRLAMDDKGKSLGANFSKLLAGRADVAIGSEVSGMVLLADPQFAGKIEALPIAFSDEPYFLGVSKRYYDANTQAVERMWANIARIRKTAAYAEQMRKAMDEAARTLKE